MVIVDTAAVIDIGRGKPKAVNAVVSFEKRNEPLRISPVTHFELAAGSPAGIDDRRRTLLARFSFAPLTAEMAENAGILWRELRDGGREIGSVDALIAATGLAMHEPVLTPNAKHFKRIKGLEVTLY